LSPGRVEQLREVRLRLCEVGRVRGLRRVLKVCPIRGHFDN